MSPQHPLVLVVEDEAELASLYASWLEPDCGTRTATGGQEALEELDREVDVVLLDRRMPGLSGDDVLEEIRRRDLDARVAMVTAVEPDTDIIDMPFDEYLVKPVSQEELRRTVESLRRRSEYDERVRELFSLASKKAVLETESDVAATSGGEYERLEERIADLRTELDRTIDAIDNEEFDRLFADLNADHERT